MAGKKYAGRTALGGCSSGDAAGCAVKELTKEGVKAEELPLPVISKEALPPCKCSALSNGYLFPQNAARLPGCQLCNGSRGRLSSNSYSNKVLTMPIVHLLAILLSASCAYSDARDPNSEEGNCQYSMIGLAALSCQHLNESSKSPSVSCCTSLLHVIDELPPVGESGECCLCRYTQRKVSTPKLATAYVLCQGKDRGHVAKWSYPIQSCRTACKRKNASPDKGIPVQKDLSDGHGSSIIKILAVAVLFLILLICTVYFCWFRRVARCRDSLPVRNMEMQHREMPFESGPQIERRWSSGQLKGRRTSSGRRRSYHFSPGRCGVSIR